MRKTKTWKPVKLVDFAKITYELCKMLMPEYSSKYAPKKYTQPQLLACIFIKYYTKLTYRETTELLERCPGIAEILELHEIPDYTTLQKFFTRIQEKIFHSAAENIVWLARSRLTKKKSCILIDSTGYNIGYSRRPSRVRKNRKKKYRIFAGKGYKPQKPKRHVKHAICVDKDSLLILSQRVRKGPASDHPDFVPLLKKIPKFIDVGEVIADAGYDAEKHHEFVVHEMNARCIIPPLLGPDKKKW